MGEAKFRPHSSLIFLPIFLKLKTKKHIRDTNPHAQFGKDRFTGGVWANTQILAVPLFILFYMYFDSSLSVPVEPRVVRRPMGLKTRVSGQGSAFWGSYNEK